MATTFVAQIDAFGSATLATYESDVSLGKAPYREALQRAIDEGRVTEPGTYIVAQPEAAYGCLNAYTFEVETPAPVLRIKNA
jgi:hypothetical protein